MDNKNNKNSYTTNELENFDYEISQSEIFKNLSDENGHDFLKIFSILNISNNLNQDDLDLIFFHLTNHPNPIREAVALKLDELINNEIELNDYQLAQILKGIIDINPNVCRAMCNILEKNNFIKNKLELEIIKEINNIISEIKDYEKTNNDFFDNKTKNRKNHAKNKKLFSLYWLLEALSICISNKNNSLVLEILNYTINFSDYTIREKTAKILTRFDNPPCELLQKAKSDENFYVKNLVYDKINFED